MPTTNATYGIVAVSSLCMVIKTIWAKVIHLKDKLKQYPNKWTGK